MNETLYQLEEKRREYEELRSNAESHDEAIERGWVKGSTENRSLIESQRNRYQFLQEEILGLKKSCGREGSVLFDQLIIWHLKTALQMYSEYHRSKAEFGVQIICLGDLIQQLGGFVSPESEIFTVNTYYLKEYYEYLEVNKP